MKNQIDGGRLAAMRAQAAATENAAISARLYFDELLKAYIELQTENTRLRFRLQQILDEPKETMSNAKALKEMVRQARLGLDGV